MKVKVKTEEETDCSRCNGDGEHCDRSTTWDCSHCNGTGRRVEEVEKWVDKQELMK